ncbi:hypothetical protein GCM10010485_73330 [Streptosporangium carneum]
MPTQNIAVAAPIMPRRRSAMSRMNVTECHRGKYGDLAEVPMGDQVDWLSARRRRPCRALAALSRLSPGHVLRDR